MDQIRNAAVEWIAITNTSLIGGVEDARRQVTLHAAAKIRGMFNQFRERLRGSRQTGPSCTVRVSGRFDGTPDGGPDWDFRCRDRGDCDQQFHDVRELGRAGGRNRILLVVRGDRKKVGDLKIGGNGITFLLGKCLSTPAGSARSL